MVATLVNTNSINHRAMNASNTNYISWIKVIFMAFFLMSSGFSKDKICNDNFLVLADKIVIPKEQGGVVFLNLEKVNFPSAQNIFAVLEPLGQGGITKGARISVKTYHIVDEMVTLADSQTTFSEGERKLSLGSKFTRYSPQMNVAVLASGLKIGTKYRLVVTMLSD